MKSVSCEDQVCFSLCRKHWYHLRLVKADGANSTGADSQTVGFQHGSQCTETHPTPSARWVAAQYKPAQFHLAGEHHWWLLLSSMVLLAHLLIIIQALCYLCFFFLHFWIIFSMLSRVWKCLCFTTRHFHTFLVMLLLIPTLFHITWPPSSCLSIFSQMPVWRSHQKMTRQSLHIPMPVWRQDNKET